MPEQSDAITEFLAGYPDVVSSMAASLRDVIRTVLPDVTETLDVPARMVGFIIGPGYAGVVCTMIPSKTGVKLGLVGGAEMQDPHGLLQGTGKRHRYVQFTQPADLARPGIDELLLAARSVAYAKGRK